jgi:CRISPR-associated protein Cmr4
MNAFLTYLYLLSPLHTGGATQEGNLLGIARESHTELPYLPSSTIRGRLRAETPEDKVVDLWGNTIKNVTDGEADNLKQGCLWIGDASLLWMPVPSLSHGVVWISCPLLLQRWGRYQSEPLTVPAAYSTNLANGEAPVYLKDAIIAGSDLVPWSDWQQFIPEGAETSSIQRVILLPDQHCMTLIQMSLWRQVKVKLDEHKSVDGGFRYEEAIPPDTVMYFPWGMTAQANGTAPDARNDFQALIDSQTVMQLGGQESLGRGFVQQWLPATA